MKKTGIIIAVILLLSFVTGIYLYGQMPDMMASHWNISGEVDGYMTKFWGLFLVPLISAGLLLLFIAIPKIDPLKTNIGKFRNYYDRFVLLVMSFMYYVYLLTILWSMGMKFNMIQFLSPALAALFYYCGILLSKAKQNWFIGIRTPWTLSSEKVWNKTHRIGGKLFKAAGMIALLGVIMPDYAIYLVLLPVILFAVYTVVYSYLEYNKGK
jgi:uncharacterized membrane protein